VGVNALMRSLATLAAAVMGTLLTSKTATFGGLELPTEGAFQLCFLVGALAAFLGVAIAAGVPPSRVRPVDSVVELAQVGEEPRPVGAERA
jgi:hypothetical protein